MTYQAWNRLMEFNDSLGETTNYYYYSDGLRSRKVVGIETTQYYYDGDNVINEMMNGVNFATNL